MKLSLYFIVIIFFVISSCRTIRELKYFSKCEFRQDKISKADLGKVNLLDVNSFQDLGIVKAGQLALDFKTGKLPLTLTYMLEVRNPNDKTAAMEKLDWILEVDKQQVLNGTTSQRVEVTPNGGTASFPLSISLNVREVLSKKSLESIVNLVGGIKGTNEDDTGIRLKIKPRFKIFGATMAYPGYIKVGKTFRTE